MCSMAETDSRHPFFGLRLALWYATLFVIGSIAIVFLTYYVLRVSLEQRDQQIIQAKIGEYANAYQRGGFDALADTVRAEQRTAPERLFVRVVDRGAEAIVLSQPQGWNPEALEMASVRLRDGTLVQVGKSTEAREDLLARFRAALGIVTLLVVVIALGGGLQLTRGPVSLHEVVDRAVDLYRDVAETKGVRLTVAPGDAVVVSGDRTRLEQVAANLIDNAVKYTAAGGRVDVEVARDGGRALLRVRDTGAGIPADELPRIWDRLFRGDTSRAERGLGLGLSLVKAIVEAHGGSVAVESEPGRGSTFTVALSP